MYSLKADKISDWTFAIYMDTGGHDLNYWLQKNTNDMALAKFDRKKLNIVTQVHIETQEASRYTIYNKKIKLLENTTLSNDCGQNIVDFVKFVANKCPAKHYGLIFWGHGFGILDPVCIQTNTGSFNWDIEPDEPGYVCNNGVCPLKIMNLLRQEHTEYHKGFMFNDTQSFVSNKQMVQTLKTIKETVLNGQKLDIMGTDCCKMSMLEIVYQIKDFVNFFVGSQNCELKDGWNYRDFFSSFNDESLDTLAVVNNIIKTYDDYYVKNTIKGTYTLSAIDLSQIDSLVKNFNEIIVLMTKLMLDNKTLFKSLVLNARINSPSMCSASYYLDLWAVYNNLLEELCTQEALVLDTKTVTELKELLLQGKTLIEQTVIAISLGTAVKNFKGISFYFPRNKIDDSYIITKFGQETEWVSFLRDFIV
jgi:hypothetical protein